MSKQTIQVRGVRVSGSGEHPVDLGQYSDVFDTHIHYKESFQFSAAQRGESVEDHDVEIDNSDLVEVEYEDGSARWMTVDRAGQEFGVKLARGSDETLITAESFAEVTERGLIKSAVKGLKFFGIDLEDWAVDKFAEFVSEKLEKRACPSPGLFQVKQKHALTSGKFLADSDNLELLPAGTPPIDHPILLFIHGTGSSFTKGYRGLWQLTDDELRDSDLKRWGIQRLQRWREFIDKNYGDHVYAFEHKTLSESPIDNAIDLLESLSENARVHVISHSRGGLIGELLCRSRIAENGRGSRIVDNSPFTTKEIQAYGLDQKPGRDLQQTQLKKLNKLLKEKNIIVERFLRVACPTRGTTLADGKLDDWLSGFTSLVERFLPIENNDLYYLFKTLTIGVIKAKADPSMLPGMEAMMTDSPLVGLINAGPVVEADLSIITGQTESESWIPWMWPIDRFYKNQYFPEGRNDLVVPTLSMQQGHRRQNGARIFNDKGSKVNHFNYFHNRNTFERLIAGLERGDTEDAGFSPVRTTTRAASIHRGETLKGPHPRVIIVPGITGSHLRHKDDRLWLQYHEIIFGGMGELAIDKPGIDPDGVIEDYYEDLARYLEANHEVIRFGYDWRDSIVKSGECLGHRLKQALDDDRHPEMPVHIIAHSMGGLVSRAMIHLNQQGVWQQFKQNPANRLIMMGTPNGGAYAIPRQIMGRDSMIALLSKFDIYHSKPELLNILRRFPGILGLLPRDNLWDFKKIDTWRRMKSADPEGEWPLPETSDLQQLKSIWECLSDKTIDADHMLYVAGKSPVTISEMKINGSGANRKVEFLATNHGDGQVPWETGIPKALKERKKAWFMPVVHGDLCRHKPAFPAVLDLLTLGETNRLPRTSPASRGQEKKFIVPKDRVPFFPDQDMIMAAAIGASLSVSLGDESTSTSKEIEPTIVRVGITHGDLHHIDRPVLAGHYIGDTLISAEAALDQKFNGELNKIRRLGIYPGPIGSSEMVLDGEEGAIIAGLGQIGELTPAQLRVTLKHALIRYARSEAENECSHRSDKKTDVRSSVTIASLLIGSGRGGVTKSESIREVLNAVRETNSSLNKQKIPIMIGDLEFIELFEDTAIITGKTLQKLADDPELQNTFAFEPVVNEGYSGRRREHYQEAPGWWRRLHILSEDDGSLKYTTPTDKARVEVTVQPTQRILIENFLKDANRLGARDKELEQALFELLVPNKMKDHVPDQQGLVLMLDQETARFPWEMLNDFRSRNTNAEEDEPLAVKQGMVRQLYTDKYRARPQSGRDNTALVIGDPISKFVSLPGAREEASQVSEFLRRSDFEVNSLIGEEATAGNVIKALFSGDCRVMHLSGHGVYEYDSAAGEKMTGMVLGDDIFLTSGEVEQLRVVPELVFINCCLLGKIEPEKRDSNEQLFNGRAALAANLATQFIYMGARAVVAAGWEVDDSAAQVFAENFYQAMLSGKHFGEAVQQARCAAYKQHGRTNTWGAYQCYGDPDYQLDQHATDREYTRQPKSYVSPREPQVEIENIISAAKKGKDDTTREYLLSKLQNIIEDTPEIWFTRSAQLPEKLGKAFGELYDFTEAVHWYSIAVATSAADYSIQTVEQRANLRARLAEKLSENTTGVSASRMITESISDLKKLDSLQSTPERLSLIASAYKSKARLYNRRSKQRSTALKEAAEFYFKANERAFELTGKHDPYPLFNGLIIAQMIKTDLTDKKIETLYTELKNHIQNRKPENFWEKVSFCDFDLLQYLVSGQKNIEKEKLIRRYQQLLKSASDRERDSIVKQIEFVIEFGPKSLREDVEGIIATLNNP